MHQDPVKRGQRASCDASDWSGPIDMGDERTCSQPGPVAAQRCHDSHINEGRAQRNAPLSTSSGWAPARRHCGTMLAGPRRACCGHLLLAQFISPRTLPARHFPAFTFEARASFRASQNTPRADAGSRAERSNVAIGGLTAMYGPRVVGERRDAAYRANAAGQLGRQPATAARRRLTSCAHLCQLSSPQAYMPCSPP